MEVIIHPNAPHEKAMLAKNIFYNTNLDNDVEKLILATKHENRYGQFTPDLSSVFVFLDKIDALPFDKAVRCVLYHEFAHARFLLYPADTTFKFLNSIKNIPLNNYLSKYQRYFNILFERHGEKSQIVGEYAFLLANETHSIMSEIYHVGDYMGRHHKDEYDKESYEIILPAWKTLYQSL